MSNNASKGILNIPALQFESPQIDLTTVTQIQSALEEMSRDMGRAADYVQKIIKEHEDIWAKQQPIWDEYWKEQTKQIAEGMKRVHNAFQKSEAVGKYGWTIPLNATRGETASMFEVIVDEVSADAAFVWYFTHHDEERLGHLIQKTISNSMLQHWRPLLEEAIFCLQEKKYRACISSLLPIVDGLCAQRFSIPQFQRKKERQKFVSDRRQHAIKDNDIDGFMWLSFIGFADTVFQAVDFDTTPINIPPVLNRHILLHGRDIPQAKLEDCLRLLQALDTITSLDL